LGKYRLEPWAFLERGEAAFLDAVRPLLQGYGEVEAELSRLLAEAQALAEKAQRLDPTLERPFRRFRARLQGEGERLLRKLLRSRLGQDALLLHHLERLKRHLLPLGLPQERVYPFAMYALRHPDEAIQHKSLPGEVWRDKKGLSFVDVSARPFWDYILALAREARAVGFDELNFYYIRFPSDGDMESVAFPWTKDTPKPEALERFFAFLHQELRERDHIPISADLFGMTTTVHHDLNIGQVLERAAPYFDFIAPMVYPSHYPPGYLGLANSNSDPYRVVFNDLSEAARRLEATTTPIRTLRNESPKMRLEVIPASSSTPTTTREVFTGLYQKSAYPRTLLRPWLQDFDYGGNYGPKEVRAQIQAVYDVGLTSWMLWSPSNRYTSEALEHSGAQAPGG
jgi:hypothetical protein